MSLVAVLSNPTLNKIYALGDGKGGVCDFGTTDRNSGTLSFASNGKINMVKTGLFTEGVILEGDPILITGGTHILPGVKRIGKRLDNNTIQFDDDPKSLCPYEQTLTLVTPANFTDGDTITFTPPAWYSSTPIVYRFKTVMAAINDIQIGAGLINSIRSLQRCINQIATSGTDYFANSVGLSWLWASPPTVSGVNAIITLQSRMILPGNVTDGGVSYGTVSASIAGGSIVKPGFRRIQPEQMISADVTFRIPENPGCLGNVVNRGRLLGAIALGGGAADIKLRCWGAGYISDAAGAGTIIPRADYFEGYGNIAPLDINLPIGTFVPFGSAEEGTPIAKAGFLFTISGTTPKVAIYFEDN